MSPPWMPLYIADYLADTSHLSAAEHGAYLLLIMHYWRSGGLPSDDVQLARIASMSAAEWKRSRPAVAAFFHDGWKHARIDAEIAKAAVKHERRQEAGKRGGKAKSEGKQNPSNATRLLEQNPSNALASSSQPHSEAKASAAEAAPADDPKVAYFRRCREVLGQIRGGSVGSKLLRAQGNEDDPKALAKARSLIETASTKSAPVEWLGRAMAPGRGGDVVLTDAGNPWPEGII